MGGTSNYPSVASRLRLPGLAALCVLLAACPDPHFESCGRGDNMSNVRLEDGFEPLADAPVLVIRWDPGEGTAARLPDAYFADVAIAQETDPEVIDEVLAVESTGPRELSVRFRNLTDFLHGTDRLNLVLEFSDRWDYLECSHAGMDDRYLLYVDLVVDSEGVLIGSSLEQQVDLGPI